MLVESPPFGLSLFGGYAGIIWDFWNLGRLELGFLWKSKRGLVEEGKEMTSNKA